MTHKQQRVDKENAQVVVRGDYVKTLDAIADGDFCPFCEEHLAKHHKHPILHKTEYWLLTHNAWPYGGSVFHLLFIARPHLEAIEAMPSEMVVDLHKLYQKVIAENAIMGGTLMIRSGNTAITGASVNHLHAHLIVGSPRTEKAKPITALIGFNKE